MLVGLQGSGKTTSAAKMGLVLKKSGKKVLLASLDVQRPAAMEQLQILGDQTAIDVLPIVQDQKPVDITKRSYQEAKLSGHDVVILDTAGRASIDNELMNELSAVYKESKPSEVFLVADAMTGQEAANVAKSFKEKSNVTSIILTRVDGDARGGAALSMSDITNCPIKFMGTGEKLDAFELEYIRVQPSCESKTCVEASTKSRSPNVFRVSFTNRRNSTRGVQKHHFCGGGGRIFF